MKLYQGDCPDKMKGLFDDQIDNKTEPWEEHWKDMPEYNNKKEKDPEITATFKFKTIDDFKKFEKIIKEYLYHGKRIFDGKQLKNKKSAWYPLPSRPSEEIYILED